MHVTSLQSLHIRVWGLGFRVRVRKLLFGKVVDNI